MIKSIKIISLCMILGIKANVTQLVTKDQNGNNLNEFFLLKNDNKMYVCASINGFDEKGVLEQTSLTNVRSIVDSNFKVFKIGNPLIEGNKKFFPAVVRASGIGGFFGRTDTAQIEVGDTGTVSVTTVSTFGHRTDVHKIAFLQCGNVEKKVIVSGSSAPTIKFSSSDLDINKTEWQGCYLLDVVGDTIYFLIQHPTLKKWYVDFKKIKDANDIKAKPELKARNDVEKALALVPLSEKKEYTLKDNSKVIIDSRIPEKVRFSLVKNQSIIQTFEWENVDLLFAGSDCDFDSKLTMLIFKKYDQEDPDYLENFTFQDIVQCIGCRIKQANKLNELNLMTDEKWKQRYEKEKQKLDQWYSVVNDKIHPLMAVYISQQNIPEKEKLEVQLLRILHCIEVKADEFLVSDMEQLRFVLRVHLDAQNSLVEILSKTKQEGLSILKNQAQAVLKQSLVRVYALIQNASHRPGIENRREIALFDLKNAPVVSIDKKMQHKNIISFLPCMFNPQYSNKKYLFFEKNGLFTKDTL